MSGSIDSGTHFAYEMQGLQRLKTTNLKDPNKGVKQASEQFEALFLQQMFKSMRAAIPKSDLLNSSTTDLYTEMYDAQMAQSMAGKGLGLAEMIEKQMRARGMVPNDPREYQENIISGIPRSTPKQLYGSVSGSSQIGTFKPQDMASVRPEQPAIEENIVSLEQKKSPFRYGASDRAPHVQAFLDKMSGPALVASDESGVPAKLILAQAALETGWGKEKIKTERGADSFNVFGIKAGSYWEGPTTNIKTTEYVNGVAQKSVEKFRVYQSYEEAFYDYARLIKNAPRYQGVVNATNEVAAAHAIQRGGYATDPAYANKLIAVMANLDDPESVKTLASFDVKPFGSDIW